MGVEKKQGIESPREGLKDKGIIMYINFIYF
jgi:hypothetical protein